LNITSVELLGATLKLFASQAFDSVEINGETEFKFERDHSKTLFGLVSEKGSVTVRGGSAENLVSSFKLAGFTQITNSHSGEVKGVRGEWQAAGAPLKRKEVEEPQQKAANPWAALQNGAGAGTINEDDLMKDVSSGAAVQKFCGEDDKVKAGKPCANCTCGRKE
jgi:hypothetical protein